MANLNPIQLLSLLRGGNPQAVAQQIIQQNYPNDPTMKQLLELGQKGDTQALNQFAQQFFARNGRDFQTEFNSFMASLNQL
ncbi:MAG: hypothetical protein UIC49_02940 [Paludibacteraceae bacterium]|nr:hypothetical protein [Paludibacteraceae bacterium]